MALNREAKAVVIDEVSAELAQAQSVILEALSDRMVGPLIYGISKDPVAAAKVMNDFAKTNELFVIKAGAMPNYLMDAAGVKALASMPSRDELLATLVGTMQAPIVKFVRTLNEVPASFVRTVDALRAQRESQSA